MFERLWLRALVGKTFARIYARHMRWFAHGSAQNDDGARVRK